LIRFDERNRRLTLSVRDLADENDYRFSGPTPLSLRQRAALGRLEHEVHQGSREETVSSYRRERSITYETRLDGWTAVVTGRIDGIYTDAKGRTVIEEVKTVVGSPSDIEAVDGETFPAYTRQLQLYRYLLEAGSAGLEFEGDAPDIALHLCLIALPSRHQRTLELSYQSQDCQGLVERRLRELIAAWALEQEATARRKAAAETVKFPHAELRPSQEAMIEAIAAGLTNRQPVLVSAPPGIGKTAGALVPALRHALSIGGRVFVATSKTTQQAMFAKTLRLLREAGAPVRAVVLQAKEKSCLNDTVHCHPEACEFARDYADKLSGSGAVERLLEAPVADPAAVRAEAEAHRFCPFEASLDLTGHVDVIVGDYNYVFDPGASLKRVFQDGDPSDVILLIDEAHNLYERGMAYYSPALSCELLRELERALLGRTDPISRRARGVARRLLEHLAAIDRGGAGHAPAEVEEIVPPGNMFLFADPEAEAQDRRKRSSRSRLVPLPAASPPPPAAVDAETLAPEREVVVDQDFFTAVRDELNELSVAWFAEGTRDRGRPAFEEPINQLNRAVNRFVNVLELEGDEFSTLWRRRDGGSLRILCKDPSRQLGRRIRACGGAVAVSATLEPLDFYRDVLGFGPEAAMHAFPSPFDRSRRKVLVLDLPSTRLRDRPRDLPIVEDAVRAVLAARTGNYLVCCPSFEFLDQLHQRLGSLPGLELRRQARFMDDAARRAELLMLAEAAAGNREPIALLVVQGGIFTEGVDYPGDLCVGAVIVGPGLPRVSFERELIQAHFEQRYGKGFDYAFPYPGMNKVIQAAGRVIRTPTDRGVVALVGRRFATRRYAQLLPRDWYERRPRELVSRDPYTDLRAFWEQIP
jgi:DNA excision repair protein ERCC-2